MFENQHQKAGGFIVNAISLRCCSMRCMLQRMPAFYTEIEMRVKFFIGQVKAIAIRLSVPAHA
jgi:hypothetical protein